MHKLGKVREALRNPNDVLNSLENKATSQNYQYQRIYRNLYNPNFYLLADQKLYHNKEKRTAGITEHRLTGLIKRLKNYSYQPKSVKPKDQFPKNGETRLWEMSFADDQIVQEIIRMILTSIYEPTFLEQSHGFRPEKSCHTALKQIKSHYSGLNWFIKGDINGCFKKVDQHLLIKILRRRIRDEYFLGLIWKFIRAGYLDKWEDHKTYSGTAQGPGISQILANIYLHELDVFIDNYKKNFDKSHCRLMYCRYADAFLIGIIGNKEDAQEVKDAVKNFLQERLKLELSEKQTQIIHATQKVRFLGYDITTSKITTDFIKPNGLIKLYIPKEKWMGSLLDQKILWIQKDRNGKEKWMPVARSSFVNRRPEEIIAAYNGEINGMYNYYVLANNVSVLNKFYYVMAYSMDKTFACKYRCSMIKIKKKYTQNGVFTISNQASSGEDKQMMFYQNGFGQRQSIKKSTVDQKYPSRNS